MRLQFVPLALCLFIALLLPENILFGASTTASLITKTTDITTTKVKTKKLVNKNDLPKMKNISPETNNPKNAKNGKLALTLTNNAKSSFEEFSYNSNIEIGTVRQKNSNLIQKKLTPPAEIDSASFSDGMFYGFTLMIILLNLVCFFLFEEKTFLLYSLSLTMVGSLLFFSDGLYPIIGLPELSTNLNLEATMVLASCFFGAWFASQYLNIQEVLPKLRWVSLFLFSTSAIAIIMDVVAGIESLASVANLLSFTVLAMYFLAGVYLFSKKNYPKFYVIAYSIPLLFAIDYFVLRNLGMEFLSAQPSHIKAAVIAEMLLLTYAIVYRMKAIKEENQLRQTELRIFLKRQEIVNRKNAQQLIEEVYLENLIMHYDLDGFEIKLLQYISEGKDNVKIARKLKTSEAEIEALTKELYHKLEISEHIQEDYRMVDAQADYIYN